MKDFQVPSEVSSYIIFSFLMDLFCLSGSGSTNSFDTGSRSVSLLLPTLWNLSNKPSWALKGLVVIVASRLNNDDSGLPLWSELNMLEFSSMSISGWLLQIIDFLSKLIHFSFFISRVFICAACLLLVVEGRWASAAATDPGKKGVGLKTGTRQNDGSTVLKRY
jgi:hypothetical protein